MAREQRRLAAILDADVVGYSRLMGRDESGTLARLREIRTKHIEPTVARHGGRVVKLTGDGVLVEFASAVDALRAAIDIQQAISEDYRDLPTDSAVAYRIGLHLGDVIVEADDLYGDDVNIAARLQELAPAGGIVVSGTVREAVAGRVSATFTDLGSPSLKNIERPVQAHTVGWEPDTWKASTPAEQPSRGAWVPSKAAVPVGARRLLMSAVALAVLLVVAGLAYLAFAPRPPSTAELRAFKAEDLERLLAERRAADEEAAAKQRQEEALRRKLEADAEILRQADADLKKAQQDRQKVEQELAKLKAHIEEAQETDQRRLADKAAARAAEQKAQRKAEEEIVALRQIEQEAERKATAEAENMRQAEGALAKAQTEREGAAAAKRKADTEMAEATARAAAVGAPIASSSSKQAASALATSSPTAVFDGTYFVKQPDGPVTVSFTVTNDRGWLTISKPGCSPPPLIVAISPEGKISGEGNWPCVLLDSGRDPVVAGPLRIEGHMSAVQAIITVSTRFRDYVIPLPRVTY
jgi:class 3 adenylate cyclase